MRTIATLILLAGAVIFAGTLTPEHRETETETLRASPRSWHWTNAIRTTFNAGVAVGADFCKNIALGALSTTLSDLFAGAARLEPPIRAGISNPTN